MNTVGPSAVTAVCHRRVGILAISTAIESTFIAAAAGDKSM
jgi:hypothetical protein